MTKNEVRLKMYRDCHRVCYLHLGIVDGVVNSQKHSRLGMSKEQFRKKMMEDLGNGKTSD